MRLGLCSLLGGSKQKDRTIVSTVRLTALLQYVYLLFMLSTSERKGRNIKAKAKAIVAMLVAVVAFVAKILLGVVLAIAIHMLVAVIVLATFALVTVIMLAAAVVLFHRIYPCARLIEIALLKLLFAIVICVRIFVKRIVIIVVTLVAVAFYAFVGPVVIAIKRALLMVFFVTRIKVVFALTAAVVVIVLHNFLLRFVRTIYYDRSAKKVRPFR